MKAKTHHFPITDFRMEGGGGKVVSIFHLICPRLQLMTNERAGSCDDLRTFLITVFKRNA